MSSSTCWKCLARSQLSFQFNLTLFALLRPSLLNFSSALSTPRSSFSTSAPSFAERNETPKRGTNTLRIIKKRPIPEKGKPPAAGERKALRKRIVLSNTNALEVELPDLNENMILKLAGKPIQSEKLVKGNHQSRKKSSNIDYTSHEVNQANVKNSESEPEPNPEQEPERELVGSVVGLSNSIIDNLRAVDAFKTTQSWELFRRPSILIREESKTLASRLVEAQDNKTTLRMVIDGSRGTGKSMLLLYAMIVAFTNKWIVIHIPEAQEATNAVTEYAPIPNSNLFSQNMFMSGLLDRILNANQNILEAIQVKKSYSKFPTPIPKDCSLYHLCQLGVQEPEFSWPFFLAFWSEIITSGNPPIMMCLDGLSHILQKSLYLRPDLSQIHSHDLAIVRHYIDYLSGAKTLPNGGAFLAATSRSHAPASPTLELAIQRSEQRALNQPEQQPDPYEKYYDKRSDRVLENLEFLKIAGLSKNETRGLLEYWAKSGILKAKIDEVFVAEKWALAGNGIFSELQRSSLWMRI